MIDQEIALQYREAALTLAIDHYGNYMGVNPSFFPTTDQITRLADEFFEFLTKDDDASA